MTKSRAAFEFNVQHLGPQLNFWTFTLRRVHALADARRLWKNLQNALARAFPDLQAVRVFELHPGGHGLHVHLVTPDYLRVEAVRAVLYKMEGVPWGRLHVEKVSSGIERYLAKYLTKQHRARSLRSVRLWAVINARAFGDKLSKVKNIVINTPFSFCWRAAQRAFRWEGRRGFVERWRTAKRLEMLSIVSACAPGKWPGGDYDASSLEFHRWYHDTLPAT